MRSQYSEQPDRIMYQLRLDGIANVWLRNNIEEVEDIHESEEEESEPSYHWEADEIFFTTNELSASDIESKFDELWEYYSSSDVPIDKRVFSVEQDSRDINNAVAELSEIISEDNINISDLTDAIADLSQLISDTLQNE